MVFVDGIRVDLYINELLWDNDYWWIDDGFECVEVIFFFVVGDEVKVGEY